MESTEDFEEPIEEQEENIEKVVEKKKSKRRPLTEEEKEKKREYLKKANQKRLELYNAGKKAIEQKENPPPPKKEEIIQPVAPAKPKRSPPKPKNITSYEYNEEPISHNEIREYIRLKKAEEDNFKRIYMLKQQKEAEERYRLGYSSLFNM